MNGKFREIIEAFGATDQRNGECACKFPAHEDQTPSMTMRPSDDGQRLLIRCHAGCSVDDILDAKGLTFKDLFIGDSVSTRSRITHTYPYMDENGNELFQVCRMEPKTFRQRHKGDGGEWEWNMNGVRRVLYNLPLIIEKYSWPVVIVEGEKDCLSIINSGVSVVPTTNVGGAGKWRNEYSEMLCGRRVAVVPDNDEAGREHAAIVAGSLMVHGASSIRIVKLENLPSGGDVTDYINLFGKDAFINAVVSTPEWTR